jgi:dipeptidyl-peptidase-4
MRWIAAALLPILLAGQDRLETMPGYDQYQRMRREIPSAVKSGALSVTWTSNTAFEYTRDGKRYRFDLSSGRSSEVSGAANRNRKEPQAEPERGRQFDSALSPDGKFKALYRSRNVWLVDLASGRESAVTTEGSETMRVKYGTATWAYGEELDQKTAMWWSPDSRKLAYYRFDESQVPDYYIATNLTGLQSSLDVEPYPKAGAANAVVDLFIFDVESRRATKVDVRSGKSFDDDAVGHYIYHVEWTRDGRELLFFRTNRRQNVMEVAAADPETGACRVVLREAWPTGWVNEDPRMVFLDDGRRFIWESQRNGWNNFYLHDLSGAAGRPITNASGYEAWSLVKLDEAAGALFYMARDGDNPLKQQLHRVGLDGSHDVRLTDGSFHHTVGNCLTSIGSRATQPLLPGPCGVSPDGAYVVDVYQTHDTPPATRVLDARNGRVIAEVARSDSSKFDALGLKKAELYTFTAADRTTTLRGVMQFPSTFTPEKKYPALVSVYAGPEFSSSSARETFVTPSSLAEFGFLMLNVDSRGVPGVGKRTLDSLYLKLGQAEVDDIAEGVKAIWNRPYVDKTRIGIFGTSYGGYVSLMELLRHPEVFAAASASSPPTDWRNYDSIYTERYMGLPRDNADGYDAGSAIGLAKTLKGRLLLYYGTADNNVHPSNSLQLIKALQEAGKSFELQIGPDRGHSAVNQDRMMEFFIEFLR